MPLQTKVKLHEESHRYYDDEGLEYLSISGVIGLIKPFFDREARSKSSAEKRGISQAEILAEWDGKAKRSQDHGTAIHKAIEHFQNTAQINSGDEKYEKMIRDICCTYTDYPKVMQEECLYDAEYRIAGTADKILQVTTHKAGKLDIEDYKTNLEKGIQFYDPYGGHCLHPIEHLENCNFIHYALQLSFYAFMAERLTGRKVRRLSITYIPPENEFMNWRKIPVPYMKTDVINILKFYKQSILNKVTPTVKNNVPAEFQEEPNF